LQKSIAFFDFDGTITTKDTMLELARFKSGSVSYLLGMFIISPWLIAMKMGTVSKQKAKEKLLAYFFGDTDLDTFNNYCINFNKKKLPSLIKKQAMVAIKNHRENNIAVVIVSASAENWVAPWCKENNLQFICTRLKIKNNKITGELDGENCNGNEKVCRIKELFNLADFDNIYCYGDTAGDEMMLGLATHAYYRPFKQ